MAAEAVDAVALDVELRAHFVDGRRELRLDERRDRAVENDCETRVLDVPAHDPLRVGPELLGRALDPREAVLAAGDDRGRGAVAEQRGCDHCSGVVAVEADRDRAGLDGDEQPVGSRIGGCELRREAEAVHSARTAEAEHRNPPHVVTKADLRPHARVEARRGNSSGGDHHDAIDLVRREPRLLDRGGRRLGEHCLASFQVEGIALTPAVARQVPVLRRDDVAPRDPGIVEYGRKAVEQCPFAAERFARKALCLVLFDDVRRNRGRE